jgi:hypothetical protein
MNPFTPVVTYNIRTNPTTTYITPVASLGDAQNYYYSSLSKQTDKQINQSYYKHPLFYDFSKTAQKASSSPRDGGGTQKEPTSSGQHLLLPFFTPSHFSTY